MEILTKSLIQLAVVIAIFLVLTILAKFIHKLLISRYGKSLDMNKFLPEDEVHTLRQVFYLILMALCVVNIFYSIAGSEIDVQRYLYYFVIFDVALSLYFAINLDMSSLKNKVLWLMLVPYGSLAFPLFDFSFVIILDIIH